MRKYQAIWERIKNRPNHEVTIECHPALFPRVTKAVIKEKHQDLGFKILNEDDYLFLDIKRDVLNKKITFKLRQKYGLDGVKVS